jgi:hypothetical protein
LYSLVDARDVVRGDAALLVGRAGQRAPFCGPEREALYLRRVAHGVDGGVGGAHMAVGDDAALFVQLQSRRARDGAVGRDADGEDDEVGFHAFAALERDADGVAVVLKAGDAVAQVQFHAVFLEILVQQLGHLKVQRRHDLVQRWIIVTSSPARCRFSAISRPMKPPPTTTALFRCASEHQRADAHGVRDGPERLHRGGVDAGDRRAHGEEPVESTSVS